MQRLSRMIKNQELHNAINQEIALKQQTQDERSIINKILHQLKLIDEQHFIKIIQQFEAKNQFEKLYIDKDKSKNILPDELKFDIKRYISDLNDLWEKKDVNSIHNLDFKSSEEEDIDSMESKFFKSIRKKLSDEQMIFNNNINSFHKNKPKLSTEKISIRDVYKFRNKDKRTTIEMLKAVNKETDEKMHQVEIRYKNAFKVSPMRWVKWLLPIIVIIMFACVLTIALLVL